MFIITFDCECVYKTKQNKRILRSLEEEELVSIIFLYVEQAAFPAAVHITKITKVKSPMIWFFHFSKMRELMRILPNKK